MEDCMQSLMNRFIKIAAMAAALVVTVAPAMAQKVYVDYDRDAKFESYKTFAWAETPETSLEESSPLMHSRIKNAIEYKLTQGGLIEAKENPDLWVTYHTNPREEVRFNTTTWGYGYGSGWNYHPYWGAGVGTATTSAYTYTRGTLIVDIWDAKEDKALFRGSAEAIVKEKPEKVARQIDKAVDKIAKKFRDMRAEQKKQEAKAGAGN
jgi:hypothetical protein